MPASSSHTPAPLLLPALRHHRRSGRHAPLVSSGSPASGALSPGQLTSSPQNSASLWRSDGALVHARHCWSERLVQDGPCRPPEPLSDLLPFLWREKREVASSLGHFSQFPDTPPWWACNVTKCAFQQFKRGWSKERTTQSSWQMMLLPLWRPALCKCYMYEVYKSHDKPRDRNASLREHIYSYMEQLPCRCNGNEGRSDLQIFPFRRISVGYQRYMFPAYYVDVTRSLYHILTGKSYAISNYWSRVTSDPSCTATMLVPNQPAKSGTLANRQHWRWPLTVCKLNPGLRLGIGSFKIGWVVDEE